MIAARSRVGNVSGCANVARSAAKPTPLVAYFGQRHGLWMQSANRGGSAGVLACVDRACSQDARSGPCSDCHLA